MAVLASEAIVVEQKAQKPTIGCRKWVCSCSVTPRRTSMCSSCVLDDQMSVLHFCHSTKFAFPPPATAESSKPRCDLGCGLPLEAAGSWAYHAQPVRSIASCVSPSPVIISLHVRIENVPPLALTGLSNPPHGRIPWTVVGGVAVPAGSLGASQHGFDRGLCHPRPHSFAFRDTVGRRRVGLFAVVLSPAIAGASGDTSHNEQL